MNLQPNTMSRRVRKLLLQPRRAQHRPCRLVDLAARHSRRHSRNRRLLGFQHRMIHVPLAPARPSQMHRPRHIRAVPAQQNPKVQRHKPLRRQLGLRGPAMRQTADRSPLATIVSKLMASTPASRAINSNCAATCVSSTLRDNILQHGPK